MRSSLLVLTGLIASAFAQYDGARCGAPEPAPALLLEAESQFRDEASDSSRVLFQPIVVNTYVHVVTTAKAANDYTQAQILAQMAYMNAAYGPWNITFFLNTTDFTVNELWANSTYGSSYELAMKTALRKGGYRDLNLYFLSNLGGGLLGVCRFPVDNPTVGQLALDGCVNLAGTMPGGTVPTYDLGGTAAHEVGHWFGLFHVFQGSACTGKGDFVSDTPVQKTATRGCPRGQDSCPGKPGLDSVHNYMDYSTDICYQDFTYGQARRAHKMFNRYRK